MRCGVMGREEEKGEDAERVVAAEESEVGAGPTSSDGQCATVEPSVAAAAAAAAATDEDEANGVPPTSAAPEGEAERVYPSPFVSHEEVVGNPAAFMDTLRRFHSVMGTKFMVPVIGGRELDLHLLYVEVTQRGGLEKVTVDRSWREVIAVFKFPPTTTSASFVLRKYYVSLLHHFEQVHFHRRRGPLVAPPASLHAKSLPFKLVAAESGQQQEARKRKRALPDLQGEAAPTSFTVSGTIDGKFDHGYMVTVKMGTETLHGILYHVDPASGPSTSSCAPPAAFNVATCTATGRTRRLRKRGRRRRDPAHPKPNRSAYNFFFAEKHSKLKSQFPNREREFSKMIGESWGKLTDEERMVYQDCGLKDKERYRREMQEYRERLKLAAVNDALQEQT